jgi:hypothetical protein
MLKIGFTLALVLLTIVYAANKDKPHGHKGVISPFNGKPLPIKLTKDQEKKLEKDEPVSLPFVE